MKKVLLLLALLPLAASAQNQPEYRLEIGAAAGLMTYIGDLNGNITSGTKPAGSLVARYKPNPRTALALNVSYGRIKGNARSAATFMSTELTNYKFEHGVMDIGLRYEMNFWPFGTGQEYRGAKRLTPYIFAGLGVTICQPDKTELGMNVPIGGGVKYKAADRVNVMAEWAMHITGNDRLDGLKDPYGISSSGLFKNTDCYTLLRVGVTYDMWAKCKTCHKE